MNETRLRQARKRLARKMARNFGIKIGSRKELRRWLAMEKKNGNALQHIAVGTGNEDQMVMLIWGKEKSKEQLAEEEASIGSKS